MVVLVQAWSLVDAHPTLALWPPTTAHRPSRPPPSARPRPPPTPRPPTATRPPRPPAPASPKTCRTLRRWDARRHAHEAAAEFLGSTCEDVGCCCYRPWTYAVVEDRFSTWPRSPPSFSPLALTRKIRYLRPPILNAIELAAPAGHRAL